MKKYRKVYLDANVVFDLFDKKTLDINKTNSKIILQLVLNNEFSGYLSPITFLLTNYFILRQNTSEKESIKKIQYLESILKITTINHVTVKTALNSHFNDFEDALQYFSAEAEGIDIIVTRNAHDFYKTKVPVISPSEFIQNIINHK